MFEQIEQLLQSYWITFTNGLLNDAVFIVDSAILNALKWNVSPNFISSCRFIGIIEDYPELKLNM